mmetsp:Transcript_11979/g.34749  ORF Transcript_11979/g.34749 Transcript_11979/m.34749 type:complete len:123 (-) Transcript_11979:511-879(-)
MVVALDATNNMSQQQTNTQPLDGHTEKPPVIHRQDIRHPPFVDKRYHSIRVCLCVLQPSAVDRPPLGVFVCCVRHPLRLTKSDVDERERVANIPDEHPRRARLDRPHTHLRVNKAVTQKEMQ